MGLESNSCQKKINLKPSWVMPLLEPSQIAEECLNFQVLRMFSLGKPNKNRKHGRHTHTKSQIR